MIELYLQPLLSSQGSNQGRIAAASFPFTIGRRRDCDLRMSDPCVTRLHCCLSERDGQAWVEDLGSLNGTFVNEERVEARRRLLDGDRLRVAFIVFKVHLSILADDRLGEKAGAGRQVLVVEDDATLAESLAVVMRDWGYEVQVAHDGVEALLAACDHPPDMVLLDVQLPGMNGFQVARRLREEAGLESVRMVAMTGSSEEAERPLSAHSGVQQLLIKPFVPAILREAIGGS